MTIKTVKENKKSIRVSGLKDFNLKDIFECGQAFRWKREDDGSYTNVAYGKVINIREEGTDFIFKNTTENEFNSIWFEYFDLNSDYESIKKEVAVDEIMRDAITYGDGIRILKQDTWEMLVSFIISARNSIPSIKKTIEKLSVAFGEKIGEIDEEPYYSFPSYEALSTKTDEELREYGTSFRTKYILSAAKDVKKLIEEKGSLDYMREMSTDEAREELMKFSGVGPKVSDCILLFGLSKMDVFPVDVWVQRVMDEFYTKGKYKKMEDIRNYGIDMLGKKAGYGQQYLFYYAREKGIGKKKK